MIRCRICGALQNWREHFVYHICRECWIGHHASKIIGLIPVDESIKT